MDPFVIGFTGKARSGKSTAGQHLIEYYGFQRVRFAGPLKEMMAAIGLTPAEIDGEFKEKPAGRLNGKTPRHAMQTLGTEWGRECMGSGFWINLWRMNVRRMNAGLIVVDDVRFANEAREIWAMGGRVLRIVRQREDDSAHASELGNFPVDMTIYNDQSVEGLKTVLDAYMQRYVTQEMIDRSWAEAAIEAHPIGAGIFTQNQGGGNNIINTTVFPVRDDLGALIGLDPITPRKQPKPAVPAMYGGMAFELQRDSGDETERL